MLGVPAQNFRKLFQNCTIELEEVAVCACNCVGWVWSPTCIYRQQPQQVVIGALIYRRLSFVIRWVVFEVELPPPSEHACGPDCMCFQSSEAERTVEISAYTDIGTRNLHLISSGK
jgi:hypothetical protein